MTAPPLAWYGSSWAYETPGPTTAELNAAAEQARDRRLADFSPARFEGRPGGGDTTESLARDTVFAAVMITLNGILGLVLLIGAFRFNIPRFNAEGTGTALATVAALATLTLVLPTFTTSRPGPEFSPVQLAFAAVASLILYGVFVFTQTGRHRDFFLPMTSDGTVVEEEHADPPTTREALIGLVLLLLALVAVVGLAKVESPAIEDVVDAVVGAAAVAASGDALAEVDRLDNVVETGGCGGEQVHRYPAIARSTAARSRPFRPITTSRP